VFVWVFLGCGGAVTAAEGCGDGAVLFVLWRLTAAAGLAAAAARSGKRVALIPC
jgi:hypothetical protein